MLPPDPISQRTHHHGSPVAGGMHHVSTAGGLKGVAGTMGSQQGCLIA